MFSWQRSVEFPHIVTPLLSRLCSPGVSVLLGIGLVALVLRVWYFTSVGGCAACLAIALAVSFRVICWFAGVQMAKS